MGDIKPAFIFTDYDKISDVLMHFLGTKYQLKFNVQLSRKGQNGNLYKFHNEYGYYNKGLDKMSVSIKRDYNYYFSIEQSGGFGSNNGLVIRPNDVEILKMLIKDQIYGWFFGNKNIYGINQDKELCIKRYVNSVTLTLSDSCYMKFTPIVYIYNTTNEMKQGMRIEINSKDNDFDIPIDSFLQFSSVILNTDMVACAMAMLNYVKTKPYQINYIEIASEDKPKNNNGGGYFNR